MKANRSAQDYCEAADCGIRPNSREEPVLRAMASSDFQLRPIG